MKTNNFLTFDIEEWYHANYNSVTTEQYKGSKTSLESNVDKIIELCESSDVKSTCFVLGELAEQKPNVIKKLFDHGHEIASHSNCHKLVYNLTPKEFQEDLKESCDRIEQVIGEKVRGYRAPSWSIKEENLEWYYPILEEQGLIYSSSVYPSYTYLYGIPNFPMKAHYPIINGQETTVLEIPQSLVGIGGKQIGYAGGFYLRFFPRWFIEKVIASKNRKGESVFLYLHPREIEPDTDSMVLKLKFPENIIHYYGLSTCVIKLDRLVKKYADTFIRMDEYVQRKSIK